MLIICSEEEKFEIQNKCDARCEHCIFEKVRCPIEWNMIVTDKEVCKGKNLEVNISKTNEHRATMFRHNLKID